VTIYSDMETYVKQKRSINVGSYCVRCNTDVDNNSFSDTNSVDRFLMYQLCENCQNIIFDGDN
jgi:hypothetical protein